MLFEVGRHTAPAPLETIEPTNRARLESLPAVGFAPQQRAELVDQIATIGLPTTNYRSLEHQQSPQGRDADLLCTWGVGTLNYGQLTVYDRFDQKTPLERQKVLAQESLHANSPYDPRNAAAYGGEIGRRTIVSRMNAMADQALQTRVYYDSYHRDLARKLRVGDITRAEFHEESFTIAGGYRLTDPEHLRLIERQQAIVLARRQQLSLVDAWQQTPIRLVSFDRWVSDLDIALIHLLKGSGVHDAAGLNQHVASLRSQRPIAPPKQTTDPIPEIKTTLRAEEELLRQRQAETRLLQIAQVAILAA
ncbi:MAG TPA: hypothetical protein VHC98_00455 [Candidatus Saccharimonadales bacterium]|nr:hypothetical protein [Candidatus Saccharimonadales bacterium]